MITENSINVSICLASELAVQGKVVAPVVSTPLFELVKSTNNSSSLVVSGSTSNSAVTLPIEERIRNAAAGMISSTAGTLDHPSDHDRIMDSIVDVVSKAVRAHVSYAKNIVKPLVMDYADRVIAAMNESKALPPSARFKIEMMEIPEPLKDEVFLDALSFFRGKPTVVPNMVSKLGPMTADDIRAMMLTGDKELDTGIITWQSRMDDDFYISLWNGLFREPNSLSNTDKYIDYQFILEGNDFDRANYGLAVYLLARRLFNTVDQTANMPLSVYRNTMAQIRDFAGAMTANALDRLNNYIASNILVVNKNQITYTCKVNGVVYRKWLSNGGTPEMIYGLMVLNRNVFAASRIDDIRDELDVAWRSFCHFHDTAESNKRFDIFKDILRNQFKILLDTPTDSEKEYISQHNDYYTKVQIKSQEVIDSLSSTDMNDIYATALKVMCRSRFYYTAAEDILTYINDATKINPSITPREAALLATIQYVSDYIAGQMVLE